MDTSYNLTVKKKNNILCFPIINISLLKSSFSVDED